MKDRIVESYLKDFTEEYNVSGLPESKAFEQFINFCIVSREHPENFEFEGVSVGGNDDLGIDGIAILVNEHLVSSEEEIDFFKSTLRRLDVQFIFVQSKTSEKFDMGEIGNFLFGVQLFFQPDQGDRVNRQIRHLRKLKEYIYDSSIDMDTNPVCHLYYVTLGKWTSDTNLQARIDKGLEALRQSDLFSEVKFTPLDADSVKALYRELKLKVVREIDFERHAILPTATGIREAYIGILPCAEYLKLICDNEGNLLRRLFYDNVRDFQGNNPVNREIEETINNSRVNDKFALFNNGITIVAKSINKVGTSVKIKDYQIVNGCQTSHILFRHRASLPPKALLPLKLIVTDDADVTNIIIKATNRQTEVKVEAFESLSPFQKKLEEFYTAIGKEKDERLYYERRSKQYEHLPIKRNQIISLAAQVKCFVAMFLNEPHSTHRYYGELLKAYRNRIFIDNHSLFPYYISGYALYVLERFFNKKSIDPFFKKFRHQMLMLFRIQSEQTDLPYLNSKKERYCPDLLAVLLDESKATEAFGQAAATIQSTLRRGEYDPREAGRLRAFTSDLLSSAVRTGRVSKRSATAEVERKEGTVKWFSDVKGYGFIASEAGGDIFVHFTGISGPGYRTLSEGQRVQFTIIESPKGLLAQDVSVA